MTHFAPVFSALSAAVERGEIPGAHLLLSHRGESFDWMGGYRDRQAGDPLSADTLFRLASLSKIMTSVVALTYVQEGRLDLSDEVSRYFPALADMKVAIERETISGERAINLVEPERPMLVHDLFRHTSGLTYGQFSDSPVQVAYRAAGMSDHDQSRDDIIAKLATLPLAHHPGTTFAYSMSTDVLGWILEEIEGKSLEDIFHARLFAPLGMEGAAFRPAPDRIGHIAQPQPDLETGEIPVLGSRNFYEAGWLSGGHGLFVTAKDMKRFMAMLAGRGSLGQARILSPAIFDWMTSNHLPPSIRFDPDCDLLGPMAPYPDHGRGFGLGVLVRTAPGLASLPGTPGDFSWSGLSGTYAWVDPERDLSCALLMQSPTNRRDFISLLRRLVYGCL